MSRHVAVVGAGPAGLTAALRAAEGGARVTLLNAHPRVGLKILMSGGTRCNVTHRGASERDYSGGSRPFIARVLRAFPVEEVRAWMESLGVPLAVEEGGRYFPATDQAQTVLDALLGAAERAGVELRRGARVVRIERRENAGRGVPAGEDDRETASGARTSEAAGGGDRPLWRLGIQTVTDSAAFPSGVAAPGAASWPLPAAAPDHWLEADAVVLATGGLSYPRTGSDGTGLALAVSLSHTLVPPVPGLTPFTAADPLCESVQGIALDVELALAVDGRREAVARGSFLFTHFGYSGPAALDLSRHWWRAEGRGERAVTACFLPGENEERLTAAWRETTAATPRVSLRRWLGERLPDRLVTALCAEAGVQPGVPASQVSRERRAALIARLVARELPVNGTLGYEKAEVTAGGVELSEVDPSTLESRKAPGIYLCGEILDVDGRVGGFNFQWAWSSGTVAGKAAGEKALAEVPEAS